MERHISWILSSACHITPALQRHPDCQHWQDFLFWTNAYVALSVSLLYTISSQLPLGDATSTDPQLYRSALGSPDSLRHIPLGTGKTMMEGAKGAMGGMEGEMDR